ncbi:MAG: zinc ABC transporter substrate-binding protein [Chromatiaceae bacterium]|jgi:zinc transport system substrate-binding protein
MRRLLPLLLVLSPALNAAPVDVAVSILPQKFFVQSIGGEHVAVQVMVRPGSEPADYAPTPQQVTNLASARLYFAIGVPFETPWLPRFKTANPHLRVVDTTRGIQRQPMAPGQGVSTGQQPDPHIWLSPPLVRIQAMTIRDALIDADPAHAADYRRGYAQLAETVNTVDSAILHTLSTTTLTQRRFLVFHPAFGYFAAAYGLAQVPIEQGNKEPGPARLAKVIEQAKRHGIRMVFVEPEFSQRAADAVAAAIGGQVVTIDPLAEDWPAGMQAIANGLARALGSRDKLQKITDSIK